MSMHKNVNANINVIFEIQCIHSFVMTNGLVCIAHLEQQLYQITRSIFNYDE